MADPLGHEVAHNQLRDDEGDARAQHDRHEAGEGQCQAASELVLLPPPRHEHGRQHREEEPGHRQAEKRRELGSDQPEDHREDEHRQGGLPVRDGPHLPERAGG